jgi:hypothetical protein
MIWGLDEFLELEAVDAGCVFGQLDIVCVKCNCSYEAQYDSENDVGYECPNCSQVNR